MEVHVQDGTWPSSLTQFFDVPEGVAIFDTAEEAALTEWTGTPAAQARLVEVRPSEQETVVWVVLQLGETTGHHDRDIVTCVRTPAGRWWSSGSTGSSSDETRRIPVVAGTVLRRR